MLRSACSTCWRRLVQQNARACMARGYADAAPPPAKASPGGAVAEKKDWEDLIDGLITGDEARRELATLKTAIMNFTAKVQEREKDVAPIDWDAYKGAIDKDLLASLQAAYTGLQLPVLDDTEFVKNVDDKFAPLIKAAEEMAAHAKKRAADIAKEIQGIEQEMAKLNTMTLDEAMSLDPQTAAAVDKEISEGRYY
eukprot:jgi/Botrbrau1/2203/Bobra.101_2s0033.1